MVAFPFGCVPPSSVPYVAAAPPVKRVIRSLEDLPADHWETVEPPPNGYQFKTHMEIGGLLQEVLLDGGAVFSLITEEHLCEVTYSGR